MFASIIFFLALPALLLPFLLKLIRPPKPLHIEFSQMYLLEKVMKKITPSKKKSPWLLYLVRILTVLMLIVVLAGYLVPNHVLEPHSGVIYIVDDTFYAQGYTQSGERLWDHAQEKVFDDIGSLAPGSKVAFIGFSGRVKPWGDSLDLKSWFKVNQVSYLDENWAAMKREFKHLMRNRQHENLKIKLVYYGQIVDTVGGESFFKQLPEGVSLSKTTINDKLKESVSIKVQVLGNEKGVTIHGEVMGDVQSNLKVNVLGTTGGQKVIDVEVKNGIGKFVSELEGENFKSGKVVLDIEDRYLFDNVYYYNSQRSGVLDFFQLSHRQAEQRLKDVDYYLQKGFYTLAASMPMRYQVKSPQYWKGIKKNTQGIVLLHDPPFLSKEEADLLKDFVKDGGKLLLVPGPFTPLDLLQDRLKGIMPAELKETQKKQVKLAKDGALSKQLPRLFSSEFRGRWLFYRLVNGAETVLRYEDGSPLWLKKQHGKGEVHLMSSPFHMVWSDAVLMNEFPKLLREILRVISPEWESGWLSEDLLPGKDFPKQISSIRREMGEGEFNSSLSFPGLYQCGLIDGRQLLLPCNFNHQQLAQRIAFEPKDIGSAITSLEGQSKTRFDRVIVLLLALFLIAETYVLLHRRQTLIA